MISYKKLMETLKKEKQGAHEILSHLDSDENKPIKTYLEGFARGKLNLITEIELLGNEE